MKKNLLLSLSIALALGTSAASAQPRKYSRCPQVQIQSPAGSGGYYLSADCKTAYVLPPATGSISISGYVDELGAAGELCGSVNGDLQQIGRDLKQAQADLAEVEGQLQELDRATVENNSRCLEIDIAASNAETRLQANRTEQSTVQSRITQLESQLQSCADETCDSLRTQKALAEDKLAMLRIRESGLDSTFQRAATRRTSCQAEQTRIAKKLTDESTHYRNRQAPLKTRITQLSSAVTSLFESQRTEAGALMSVAISSDQTALVSRFAELNASAGVQFVAMPLSEVSLSFTQIKDGQADGYPVLLRANVNGLAVGADSKLHSVPFGSASSSAQDVMFGAAVGGSMTINRFAACQLPRKSDYGTSETATRRRLKDIAAQIGGTSAFKYQLQVSRKITILYNEQHLYCLIKKHSTSNGLFRSSSSTSITETSQANQWLDIAIESEDTGFDFADRETLLLDLRREMLDNALMKVATSYMTKERAQIVAPGESGAAQASRQLKKCPNLYCQFGALALDLGNALFGGSSSNSTTCENVGAMSKQTFVDTKPVFAYGTQAFTIKGK